MKDIIALIITLILAISWLRLCDFAAHRGWIDSALSRKIIHIGTGPIFVLCWLLFPNDSGLAPYLAAIVPFLITVQFVLVGTGAIKDEAAVKAMSRTGDRREILRGPLFYGIIFVILTILYWKNVPTGIIALMLMCGGDGLADILGRKINSPRLPWNKRKSIAGTSGMFLGGIMLSAIIVGIYVAVGIFPGNLIEYLPALFWISTAGTIVESLPLKDIDNITITLVAVILGELFF